MNITYTDFASERHNETSKWDEIKDRVVIFAKRYNDFTVKASMHVSSFPPLRFHTHYSIPVIDVGKCSSVVWLH